MSKFQFWCPVEITKAKNDSGEEILRLGGIASTIDKDADGEFLDPSGFDISEFKKSGVVNWHHQAKSSPATIIGEPHLAEVRKDGFYVETDLYKSSELAREVYQLAEVMSNDSKTRKLGYSIEGQVVERDPMNPKIVKKAKITGLAITHMPKNPKTFADIIKGYVDEEEEEKSLDSTSGKSLVRESVNGYKVKKMDDEVKFDTIFDTFPEISIEKAQGVYDFINKIETVMSKGKKISSEDLEKAMSYLGLDNLDDNPFLEKANKYDDFDDESEEDEVEKEGGKSLEKNKKYSIKKGKETDYRKIAKQALGEDEVDEDSDDEEDEVGSMSKSKSSNIFKAIVSVEKKNTKGVQALAHIVKAQMDEISDVKEKLEKSLEESEYTQNLLQKALKKIDLLSGTPQPRRSITKGYSERTDSTGNPFLEKGGNSNSTPTLDQKTHRKVILDILDNATFSKGEIDAEFEKAMTGFEAGRNLTPSVILRLQNEFGVNIRG